MKNRHPDVDAVERLYLRLTESMQRRRRDAFATPVSVAEIYQELVPYRLVRAELGFDMNADYEHALLRLLAGEGGYARLEPVTARDTIAHELKSQNPNVSIYREYAGCDVFVTPTKDVVILADDPLAAVRDVLDDDDDDDIFGTPAQQQQQLQWSPLEMIAEDTVDKRKPDDTFRFVLPEPEPGAAQPSRIPPARAAPPSAATSEGKQSKRGARDAPAKTEAAAQPKARAAEQPRAPAEPPSAKLEASGKAQAVEPAQARSPEPASTKPAEAAKGQSATPASATWAEAANAQSEEPAKGPAAAAFAAKPSAAAKSSEAEPSKAAASTVSGLVLPAEPEATARAQGPRAPAPRAKSSTTPAIEVPVKRCGFCDSALPANRTVRFCPFCGHDLATRPCPACAEPVEAGWAFCVACGASVAEP